jgi:energy-coupling factor transporter ATP-binding protein EcfA2
VTTTDLRESAQHEYPELRRGGQVTRPDPARRSYEVSVVGLPWEKFLRYMAWAWKPGAHICLIGPTGEGKTTLAAGLLGLRHWVMALDPKGEDETLTESGFERVGTLPQSRAPWGQIKYRLAHWDAARQWDRIENRIAEGLPARIIVGGPARTEAQDIANQRLMRSAFLYAREAGGWTVYVDEFELISSQRMFNQGPAVERMLISARRDGTSVVTSYQAQAWVSRHASRQARFAVIWPTGDRKMIQNVAEAMGRDWKQLAAGVDELPPFHVLVIPRGKSGGPLICTSAPKL